MTLVALQSVKNVHALSMSSGFVNFNVWNVLQQINMLATERTKHLLEQQKWHSYVLLQYDCTDLPLLQRLFTQAFLSSGQWEHDVAPVM